MISGLKPYPAYKDSGLPWVGKVPEHWALIPNRALMRPRKKLVGERHPEYRLLSLTKQGVIVRDVESGRGKFSADMGTSQEVRPGDLIFCLFDVPETPRTVGLSRHHGMITGAYTVFECTDSSLRSFLESYYRAMDDRKLLSPLYSGLRNTIPPSRFVGIKTPVPGPEEQGVIVRFLGYVERQIVRYVRAKKSLLAHLRQDRMAEIERSVRGYQSQPAVNRKSRSVQARSGHIPWLATVPDGWEVLPSRHLFAERKEYARPDDVQLSSTQAYGVIPQEDFERLEGRRVVKITLNLERRRHVEQDDFVISMRSFQGGLERARASGCIRSSYVVLKPSRLIHPPYFEYLLKSHGFIRALQATGDFIRDGQDINLKDFSLIDLPVPPVAEQVEIAAALDAYTKQQDTLIQLTKRELSLVSEYRTRLVADVVTGQVDVREAAAHLPDLPPEAADLDVEPEAAGDDTLAEEPADPEAPEDE